MSSTVLKSKVVDANVVHVQKFIRFEGSGDTLSRINPFDIGTHRIYSTTHDGQRVIFFLERGGPNPITSDADPTFVGYTYLGCMSA